MGPSEATGMQRGVGLARLCHLLLAKENEGPYLQASRRPMPGIRGEWTPPRLLQALPRGCSAWRLHRQETYERMGKLPEGIYGSAPTGRRGGAALPAGGVRREAKTWETFSGPSGKFAKKVTGGSALRTRGFKSTRHGFGGGEPCSRSADNPQSTAAEDGGPGDIFRGRRRAEGIHQEEAVQLSADGYNRKEKEGSNPGEESEEQQQQESQPCGSKEKEKEEKEEKELQLKQWFRVIEQLYGNASTSTAEVTTPTRISAGIADEPCESSASRFRHQQLSEHSRSSGEWQTHELLPDTYTSTTERQDEGPPGDRNVGEGPRYNAGRRHRGDGRHPGREADCNRDSRDLRILADSSTLGSGSPAHARCGPSSIAPVRSKAPTTSRKSVRSRFMDRCKVSRKLVARVSRRRRESRRSRKRKRQDREEQEQRKERKEECMEREHQAEGDRRWLNPSSLEGCADAPFLKAARHKKEELAPSLEAAACEVLAGSHQLAAVRGSESTDFPPEAEAAKSEECGGASEEPLMEEKEFRLHANEGFLRMPIEIFSEERGEHTEGLAEVAWSDLGSFKGFAQRIAEALLAGRDDGALAPFAKLLAPSGVSHPRSDRHGPRWGLFPLPVDLKDGLLQSRKCPEDSGAALWVQLGAMSLNRLAGVKDRAPKQRESKQVKRVMRNLLSRIERFLRCCGVSNVEGFKLWSEVKEKKVNYEGEEIAQPLELSYDQILNSVPPRGHGGAVSLAPLLVGRARYLLENPEACLLAAEDRVPGPASARVHIRRGEDVKVWQLLVERGVVKWLEVEKVFRDAHDTCSAGMFGVPKRGKFTPSGEKVLRVVMNLKPLNRLLTIIRGDIGDLPSSVAWTQLVISEQEELEVSQADMSSAFYLFSMPEKWLPFMSFACSYEKSEVGLKGKGRVTPSCCVLPMGWASSVGLMQMASRQLLKLSNGDWRGEMKRTSLAPPWFVQEALRVGGETWWQVYLDNFMAAEVKPYGSRTASESARLHAQAVAAWDERGVLCAADKHVVAQKDTVELGTNLQGSAGWLGGSPERFKKIVSVTMSLLGCKNPKPRWVQVVLGRWIFILQFRRPAMAILSNCWNYLKRSQDRRRWWPVVQTELAQLVCLVPLLQFDLRTQFSPLVTCSDASEGGGAIASSSSLSDAGINVGRRLSSSCAEVTCAEVLVISAFNGIGGAFRGYDLSGIKIAGGIAIEIDAAAQRVNRKAWPHVLEAGNIELIDRKVVAHWYNLFPRVTHVHVYGGFPCVHLSSARANRRNLEGEGSKLFWNLKKLIEDVESVFGETATVEFVVENVFSMDVSARNEISGILRIEPLMLCPSDLLPYNRPRLAWVSQKVEAGPGVTLKRCTRVWMKGRGVEDHQWLTPGWERADASQPFATFMKSIRRFQPPERPAGVHRCDDWTLQRWTEDDYKFPPYQYKKYNLVKDQWGNLRPLNSEERALLLGFGLDHVLFAWSAGKAKENPQQCEDKKLSLCGDSFSMFSFGWITAQLCKQWITPRTPQQLVDRMGLAPGATLAAEHSCPMSRSLGYGEIGSAPVQPEALVAHLSRHVNITGADVSLALGIPFTLKNGNHASLRAGWWEWEMVFKNRWRHHSHINSLEMRMILLSVKWRARSSSSLNCRWLHLADSMVCNYILSKGRTSSRLLQPLTREIAAFLLALNSVQLHGHVDSLENPTDEASREAYD